MSSSYRSNSLGLSHWDPYGVRRGGCQELYYCNMVEWFRCDSSLISTTNWFLQCFDTVRLVNWPVKIVPKMSYNVLSGTLSLYTTTTNVEYGEQLLHAKACAEDPSDQVTLLIYIILLWPTECIACLLSVIHP